jgi:integrase
MSHIQRITLKNGQTAHRVHWSRNGARHHRYFGPLVTFQNVKTFAHQMDVDVANEMFPRPSSLLLSQLTEQYISMRLSEHDSRREAIAMRHLVRYAGDVQVYKVDAELLHRFRDDLLARRQRPDADFARDQRTRRGVNHDLRHIRVVFRWAYKHELIDRHPFDRVELFKTSRPAPDVLTREELNRIRLALKKPDRLVMHLLRFTGLRIGEACALRVGDIDLAAGVIRLARTKNRQEERIPLDRRLRRLAAATAWLNRPAEEPLIGHRAITMTHRFRAAMERAGINKKMPTHIFRHTAGRRIIERYFGTGNAQQIAKRFLRHRTDVMTQHYTQIYEEDIGRAMKEVEL